MDAHLPEDDIFVPLVLDLYGQVATLVKLAELHTWIYILYDQHKKLEENAAHMAVIKCIYLIRS